MSRDTPLIVTLPGDGPGPDLVDAARDVLHTAGFRAEWSEHAIGWDCWRKDGVAVPESTLEACRGSDGILFGVVSRKDGRLAEAELPRDLRGKGIDYIPPILHLRRALELWIDARPVQGNGYDLVVFRESTQGLYSGFEARPIPAELAKLFPGVPVGGDSAVTLRVATRPVLERMFHHAFHFAAANGRRKVTLFEKPTRMRATGGLVLETFRDVAAEYDFPSEFINSDTAFAHLVSDPAMFDVIVGMALVTEMASDLAAQLAGGLVLHAGASIGDRTGLFQPVIDPSPPLADALGPANPIGMLRAGALLARHVGQPEVASRIEWAVTDLLRTGERHEWTPDLGGTGGTADTVRAVRERVAAGPPTMGGAGRKRGVQAQR